MKAHANAFDRDRDRIVRAFALGKAAQGETSNARCSGDELTVDGHVIARRRDGLMGVTLAGGAAPEARSSLNTLLPLVSASFCIHHQGGHPRIWINSLMRSVRILGKEEWVWFNQETGEISHIELHGAMLPMEHDDPADDERDEPEKPLRYVWVKARKLRPEKPAPPDDQLDFMGLLER